MLKILGYSLRCYSVGCKSKHLLGGKLKLQFFSYKPPQAIALEV